MGDLAAFYEDLARFQWWRRRWSRAAPGEGLEMHKRLVAPTGDGPPAGQAGLNAWLWSRLESAPPAHVLDVGCGFGATLLHWSQRSAAGRFVGLTLSPLQARVARGQAARLGMGERCEFRVQSFDAAIAGQYDTVVSVESLFHAPDLAHTIANAAARLDADGTMLLVEDMAREEVVADSNDAAELLARWRTARLHDAAAFRRSLDEAGLTIVEDVDLTAQVPYRAAEEVQRDHTRLARWRRRLPFAPVRHVVDAFLGGFALERLYARGAMEYRLLVARPAGGTA